MIQQIDLNQDGQISYEEFRKMMMDVINNKNKRLSMQLKRLLLMDNEHNIDDRNIFGNTNKNATVFESRPKKSLLEPKNIKNMFEPNQNNNNKEKEEEEGKLNNNDMSDNINKNDDIDNKDNENNNDKNDNIDNNCEINDKNDKNDNDKKDKININDNNDKNEKNENNEVAIYKKEK